MLSNAFYRDQTNIWRSLQFDPAPRAGEPLVSRRVPDYFLVSGCLAYALSSTCSSRIIVMKRFNLINVHIFKTVQWLFRWAIKTYTFSPSSTSLSLVSLITASETFDKDQDSTIYEGSTGSNLTVFSSISATGLQLPYSCTWLFYISRGPVARLPWHSYVFLLPTN